MEPDFKEIRKNKLQLSVFVDYNTPDEIVVNCYWGLRKNVVYLRNWNTHEVI